MTMERLVWKAVKCVQDKIDVFWSISKGQIQQLQAQARSQDRDMEALEARHEVEIKVDVSYSLRQGCQPTAGLQNREHLRLISQIVSLLHKLVVTVLPEFSKAWDCLNCIAWLASLFQIQSMTWHESEIVGFPYQGHSSSNILCIH